MDCVGEADVIECGVIDEDGENVNDKDEEAVGEALGILGLGFIDSVNPTKVEQVYEEVEDGVNEAVELGLYIFGIDGKLENTKLFSEFVGENE